MPPTSVSRRASVLAALSSATTALQRPPTAAPPTPAPTTPPPPERVPAYDDTPSPEAVVSNGPSPDEVDAAYAPRAALTDTRTANASFLATTTTTSAARLLANRATWGATPQLVAQIQSMGVTAWIDRQLSPSGIADGEMDALLASQWPRLSMYVWQVHDTYYPNSTGDLGTDLIQSYVARALWSDRQLLEVMVDFWTNHLVVTAPWGNAWDSAHRFHIDVVRKHALGRYADMLVAAAKHPAMLKQLDNASSTKWAPNENYGRELLELHTVGVDGGYLESDIRRSALVLTGLSTEPESGMYLYRLVRHHRGPLSLLGWSSTNSSARGEAVAVSYLQHLARHPKTARRIATKLAVRFVSDTPPSTLVDRLATVYLANDTRIAPVLRSLFLSSEFAASGGRKVKRPLENIVSTSRVLGVRPGAKTVDWLNDLLWTARTAGQAPMAWPAPNGYPDVAAAWAGAGATLSVWNWHMSQGWEAGSSTPRVAYPAFRTLLPATLPTTHGGLVDALAGRLLGFRLSSTKREAICAFVDRTPSSPLSSTDAAVGWRLPYLVALVLDSPEFATR